MRTAFKRLRKRRNQQPFRIDGIQEKRNTTVAAYKMPEHMKDMYGMGETSDSALENETYSTLKEEIGDYNGCSLRYPNFEELSVGMLYKGEVHKYCLFDKEGRVHCIFDDDVNIVSGSIMVCA